MSFSESHPPRTALIVERQRLMVPFLRDVLERAGHGDVVAHRSASARTLQRLRPSVVVLGIDTLGARPFEVIRRTRCGTPAARIVVLTRSDDPVWSALARAVGADVVLGPKADRNDLLAAVAARPEGPARELPASPNVPIKWGECLPGQVK
jgi:DNA-binding NarL/FixJ family response regulator